MQSIIPRKSQKLLAERIQCELEKKLKELELKLCVNGFTKCKNDLELVYERIAEALKIGSKFQWYEEGEKSTKFFLNLKKKNVH